ncbi:MAG TPA: TIGR03087 family PEP-CTERM/XrtA system glycosyltransferase [Steroidobacteraceae bacterium]|nr:TIGR03087 family PEP-CTERM/XrtA system glycosyltransferase [Steroidobacteraceae bacterium]
MSAVLMLAHRIPLPPNKGDRIRSFHWLQALRRRYDVYVGTFTDAPEDRVHEAELNRQCAGCYVGHLRPWSRRVLSLTALLKGEALTIAYYRHGGLGRWVAELMRAKRIEKIFVFSSSMAQFATATAGPRRVVDFCDVDSDKWAQYATRHRWPLSWIYKREARELGAAERRLAEEFDASLFVSDNEARLFRRLVPGVDAKVFAVANGVDSQYFDPAPDRPRPFAATGPAIVFTGAMDYWANVDAVSWFAAEVLPAVREQVPQATFHIVGSRPSAAVGRLASLPGVFVTGTVPDVRPYVHHAHAVVAPLRVARGVQNKVLEAMAMAKPVVATRAAVAGLDGQLPASLGVSDSATGVAAAVIDLVRQAVPRTAPDNREFVLKHYGWQRNLDRFLAIIDGGAS